MSKFSANVMVRINYIFSMLLTIIPLMQLNIMIRFHKVNYCGMRIDLNALMVITEKVIYICTWIIDLISLVCVNFASWQEQCKNILIFCILHDHYEISTTKSSGFPFLMNLQNFHWVKIIFYTINILLCWNLLLL